ncbi:MAG: cyclic nucleotide-binding domain-containing protein [Pseudomonadota bacterium]
MSLARTLAVMRKAEFLSHLGEDARKLLAFGADPLDLKPRETLFDAGDAADGAYLVLGGQLRLVPASTAIAPTVHSVGAVVDELALIIPTSRSATAIAQTSCEVVPLERGQMLRILNEFPDSAATLRAALAGRTKAFLEELETLNSSINATLSAADRSR